MPNHDTAILGNLSTNFRNLVDKNRGVFTYGLTDPGYTDSNYEDPTYLGFTIEIDDNSAIFTDALEFLQNNTDHSDIGSRLALHVDFCNKIKMLFNSQESANETNKTKYVKQHYINSVGGLQSLTKKFVKFKEDKLTFELHEDISLFSTYLAYIYNNLVFSYDTGRVLIPENLMYFNLYIKFSEIRNFTSIRHLTSSNPTDINIASALKKNSTAIIYKLTDCLFNFFEAVPFGDDVSQAGIDAANPPHSVVTFDMYFKRVNLLMNTPLLNNSYMLDNRDPGLGLKIVKPTVEETPINTEPVLQQQMFPMPELPITNLDVLNTFKPNPKGSSTDELSKMYNKVSTFDGIFQNAGNKGSSSIETRFVENPKPGGGANALTDEETLAGKTTEKTGLNKPQSSNDPNTDKRSKALTEILDYNAYIALDDKENEMDGPEKKKDKFGTIVDVMGTNIKQVAKSQIQQTVKKYENMLNTKKNEMLNDFLGELKEKTRVLVNYNVYTDEADPMFAQPLQELYTNLGTTVMDQVIGSLKDGTNINLPGSGGNNKGQGL